MKKQQLMELELIERTEKGDQANQAALNAVEQSIPSTAVPSTTASIANLIDDSDYSWSDDAYRNAGITPGTAGDPNNRAYNWFRMQRATALLVEDDAHSLKGPLHSLFGGETNDTPRWDKIDGWAELGETGATPWDIVAPLPNNFVIAGMRYYLQMLTRLRTATALPGDLKFFWEFWDNTNTAPLPDVIKGSAFVMAAATYGPLGATTRAYDLVVYTDYGDQIASTTATVTDAPASLTANNGVALSWPRYPGFTNVEIYVTVGGNVFLVGVVGDGAAAFNDVGQTLRPVPAVPSVSGSEPRAYAEARVFAPTTDWLEFDFSIVVPSTYDASKTTGKQWLRGGVIGLMGDPHQLQIDRIGVSTGFGLWNISNNDKNTASKVPSTSSTSSTQGPPSGGGGPPDDGGGGERIGCSTFETPIQVCDSQGQNVCDIPLERLHVRDYVVGKNGLPNRVTKLHPSWSALILTIETANGARRRCSPSDLWMVKDGPQSGICARRLCEGMEVATRIDNCIQYSVIMLISAEKGAPVMGIETDGTDDNGHLYYAGGAACHNKFSPL